MSLLEIKNLSYSYHGEKETKALDDISFSVEEGEFFGIVGPSGCGKTTMLNLLAGIYSPPSGSILLHGKKLSENKTGIGLMPQRDQLFPWRTVEKNVLLGSELMKQDIRSAKKYAHELLTKYGLADFTKKHPSDLSGGMRQRVSLIRTLVPKPEILLLDEPFSALDFQTRLTVCNDVHAIIKQEKKTALLVSHDISESISLCDRILVLTKRPAKVIQTVDVMPGLHLSPLEKREHEDFSRTFKLIWKMLEDKNDRRT